MAGKNEIAAGHHGMASGSIEGEPVKVNPYLDRARNVEIIARRFELEQLREEAWSGRPPPLYVELEPPEGWRHPITGRTELQPSPELLHFGRYLRRSRRLISFSQERVADAAQVSQSMISRVERGLAPAMGVDRLTRVGFVLGRALPLGFCPHEHECAWQPIVPHEHSSSRVERLVEMLLNDRPAPDSDEPPLDEPPPVGPPAPVSQDD